jgi:hypothetical protein
MVKKLWILLIISLTCLQSFAQEAQPLDDLDRFYLGFVASPPTFPSPYIADFLAVKFYYVTGDQRPDPTTPTTLYATLSYDPNGGGIPTEYKEVIRAAFNGTPLLKQVSPSGAVVTYGVKRPPNPKEDWLSWYAHLSESEFPVSLAFDTISGVYKSQGFDLSFPPPYHLGGVADSITLGGSDWTFGAEPALAAESPPAYGSMRLYPSRTRQEEAIFLANNFSNPGTISYTVPKGSMADLASVGWPTGAHEGFAAFSACNDDTVDYEGGKKLWFRACSVTLKPVTITVTEPQ